MVEPVVPRLMVEVPRQWLSRANTDSLVTLLEAGADAFLIPSSHPQVLGLAPDGLVRLRANLPAAVPIFLEDSPSLAAAWGASLLLSERGLSTAEARRQLGPGALLGRAVSSAAAGVAASGSDFLLVTPSVADPALVRTIVETAWAPVLIAIAATARAIEQHTESLAALGSEGLVLRRPPTADDKSLTAAVAGARRLLPPGWFERRTDHQEEPNVTIDGVAHALLPDTAITDLLLDLERTDATTVSVNGVSIAPRLWDDRLLVPGDDILISDP